MSSEVSEFNKLVFTLINTFEKKSRNDVDLANLDRLKRRLALVKTTLSEDIMCVEVLPIFMNYKQQILARDEKFFLGLDARRECSVLGIERIGKEDEFIFSLIDAMRKYYVACRADEKKFLWDSVNRLFEISVKYKLAAK